MESRSDYCQVQWTEIEFCLVPQRELQWVVARLIGKVALGLPLADGESLGILLGSLDGD